MIGNLALFVLWVSAPTLTIDASSQNASDVQRTDAQESTFVPGRALLRLRDGFQVEQFQHLEKIRALHRGWLLVSFTDASSRATTLARIAALRADPRVADIQVDHWFRPLLRPNDALMTQVWPLSPLGLENAWNRTQGDPAQRIGIVDTGARKSHVDLQGRESAGYDFISEAARSGDGDGRDADYFDPGETSCDGQALDLRTHGDHVTATLMGNANNGVGIAGVNWHAKYVAARAMNACGGAESDLLDALAWMGGWAMADVPPLERAVDVINLSLGTPGTCSPAMQAYVHALVAEKNVVLVAATGNEGNNVAPHSPASCDGVIAVAAHGPGATRPLAPYANFSGRVDVVAPGGDVRAGAENGILSACGESDACWQFAQGTSMAAPWVTGAISLMLALQPDLDRARIPALLRETGVPCEGCGQAVALHIERLLERVETEQPNPFVVPEDTCPAQRCGPGGQCSDEDRCLLQADGQACCIATCNPAQHGSCAADERCVLTQNEGICRPAGNRSEGAACDDDPESCSPDLLCATINERTLCVQPCGEQQLRCRSDAQVCTPAGELSICLPVMLEADSSAPEFCDRRRGNWDCAEKWACVEEPFWREAPPHLGRCIEGAAGEIPAGGRCDAAEDCMSGLCDGGLCAVPCHPDGSCHASATCDALAIPGGLCRPEPCQSNAQCPVGWSCSATDGARLCTSDASPSCAATLRDTHTEPFGFVGFFGLAWAVFRRRRTTNG